MLINEQHTAFVLLPDTKPVETDDIILLFMQNKVLLRAASSTDRFPLWGELPDALAGIAPLHAFTQANRRFFIATVQANEPAPPGFVFEGVRTFRTLLPMEDGAMLNAAYHLAVWYHQHRFCGACGHTLHPAPVERALTCGHCGLTIYPSILPAVIVAIVDGDRMLLARNAHSVWHHYSLIAGYMEVGETAEQAVRREVLEEVGLHVKNIRYTASQPWGFSQSLMLGFIAELDGAAEITLQESELSEAYWFSRDELPANDSTASIAFELMERFRRGEL